MLLQGVTVDKEVAGAIDGGLQEDGSVKESVHMLPAQQHAVHPWANRATAGRRRLLYVHMNGVQANSG